MLLSAIALLAILGEYKSFAMKPVTGQKVTRSVKFDLQYREHVLLVSDVQEYYKASSVIIVYAGDDESKYIITKIYYNISISS